MKFNIDVKKNEVVNKYESELAELKETETVLNGLPDVFEAFEFFFYSPGKMYKDVMGVVHFYCDNVNKIIDTLNKVTDLLPICLVKDGCVAAYPRCCIDMDKYSKYNSDNIYCKKLKVPYTLAAEGYIRQEFPRVYIQCFYNIENYGTVAVWISVKSKEVKSFGVSFGSTCHVFRGDILESTIRFDYKFTDDRVKELFPNVVKFKGYNSSGTHLFYSEVE